MRKRTYLSRKKILKRNIRNFEKLFRSNPKDIDVKLYLVTMKLSLDFLKYTNRYKRGSKKC